MGLYERWTAGGETKIAVHTFGSALRELARGAVTRAQVDSAFSLAGADLTELDAIIAQYTGLATQAEKDAFVVKLHDVMLLSEAGFYNRTKAAAELGF